MPYKNIFNLNFIHNQSMASSFNSDPIDLSNVQGFCIQARTVSGSPIGTIKLQVSNEIDVLGWDDMDDSEFDVPSGDGLFTWNVSKTHYDKVRVVYTSISGTGVLNAFINGKGDDNA